MTEQDRWTIIDGFQLHDTEGTLAYIGHADLTIPEDAGGSDAGQIMIRLEVDGEGPIIYTDLGTTGDVAGLMAAADALHRTIAHLTEMYLTDGSQWLGQCLGQGDWGRCRGRHGHDGEHLLPTQEIWHREQASFEAALASGKAAKR